MMMAKHHHPRLDFDPPTTPPAARSDGPDTSWEGWDHIKPTLGERQRRVLDTLPEPPEGLAGFEIAALLHVQHNWISGRLSELAHYGWVEDSGQRKVGPAGVRQIVWRKILR